MYSLLDTNILIDALRGHDKAVEYLNNLDIKRICILTYFELLQGAENKSSLEKIREGIHDFEVLELDYEDQYKAIEIVAEYKLKSGIGILDSMIAAICINRDLTLVTRNDKHFKHIIGLKVEVPY